MGFLKFTPIFPILVIGGVFVLVYFLAVRPKIKGDDDDNDDDNSSDTVT
jgi:hypothetical protein